MSVPPPTLTTSADDLLGLVLAHAELRPDSLALKDDEGSFTYVQLAEHVARLAGGRGPWAWARATGWACSCPTPPIS